jgi:molybdate transport system ATP-binding protein
MVQLKRVTVSYQGHSIFNSLELLLESEEHYLITGENGCGKTILLKLIAGKILPQNGSVHYSFIDDSLDWQQRYDLRKKYVHYIPASALHELVSTPDLYYQQRYYTIESTTLPTVRDYLGERLNDLEHLQLPDSFQLNHLLGLELTHLSNGQVKKLIILKQLLDSIPKILILDYPFEGLDAQSRNALRDFLDHLVAVHHIQLIIADHNHPQLPQAITKKCMLSDDQISVADYSADSTLYSAVEAHHTIPEKKSTEPVVEMRDLKIQYGDKVILQHLNWQINRGERWALTGRNGSGKTTLFSLIYADHPMAYSEKVFLFGRRRGTGESIWDIKKRISYHGPEQLHFLDHITEQLTVKEYLEKFPTTPERLNDLINYFQIQALLTKKLKQLSNGQLQLTLLMALFLSQKELLLLDEPFQFLDPHHKMRVSDYLETHMDESVTLVLITHYDSDVEKWTNHRMRL